MKILTICPRNPLTSRAWFVIFFTDGPEGTGSAEPRQPNTENTRNRSTPARHTVLLPPEPLHLLLSPVGPGMAIPGPAPFLAKIYPVGLVVERVTPEKFEAAIAELRRRVTAAPVGLYGPDSVTWRVNRESLIFLGAGRAILLQLAHPAVAQAIADHSRVTREPVGRFRRTFAQVFPMVFGSLEEAISVAWRVYRVHRRIQGRLPDGAPYAATDVDALVWVWATLTDTALLVYEKTVRPLTPSELRTYYTESRLSMLLFGVFPEELPGSWAEFSAYFARRAAQLQVIPAARRLADELFGLSPVLRPLLRAYRRFSAALLPEPLARGFGYVRDPAYAERIFRLARWVRPLLPPILRYLPPYLEAQARLHGRPAGPLVQLLKVWWVGG